MNRIYYINLINWLCDISLKIIDIKKDLSGNDRFIKRAKKLKKRFDKLNKIIVLINKEIMKTLSEKDFNNYGESD